MNTALATPQRSTFVTVLAWIFIVLAGFTTLIALLQNIMVFSMFQAPEFSDAMSKAESAPNVPPYFALLTRYVFVVFVLFLAVSATTLAAAIGLLRRRNWGRIVFIAMMGFGIFWNLAGLALMAVMMWMMPMPPLGAHPGAPSFAWIMGAMMVFNVLIALGFSALFAWIILKLNSPGIRAEFVPVS